MGSDAERQLRGSRRRVQESSIDRPGQQQDVQPRDLPYEARQDRRSQGDATSREARGG